MAQPNAGPGSRVDVALDLDDMRLLVVVAEEQHVGRAALRLHLSQPGLSYRIKRMEDGLGYPLLVRSGRGVHPTPAGAALVRGARQLLADARRVVDDSGRLARGEAATVRMGFVATALYGLVPPVLREVRRRHPEVRLLLEEHKTAAQVRALQRGELDLGLVHLPVDEIAGLRSRPVGSDVVGIALPADHPLAAGERVDLSRCADEAFVLFARDLEPRTHDRYVAACRAAGFTPRIEHRGSGLQTILGLVAAGLGVAFVGASVALHLTRTGVVFRPLTEHAPTLETGVAWRGSTDAPAVALVRETLLDVAAHQA